MEKFYYSVSIPVPVRKDFTYFSEEKIQAWIEGKGFIQ